MDDRRKVRVRFIGTGERGDYRWTVTDVLTGRHLKVFTDAPSPHEAAEQGARRIASKLRDEATGAHNSAWSTEALVKAGYRDTDGSIAEKKRGVHTELTYRPDGGTVSFLDTLTYRLSEAEADALTVKLPSGRTLRPTTLTQRKAADAIVREPMIQDARVKRILERSAENGTLRRNAVKRANKGAK